MRDYNRNVNSGLEGQHFRNYIGVGIFITTPLKSSPNDKMLPSFKEGAIYLLKLAHKSWKPLFCDFLGSFAIWGDDASVAHLPHGFTPTNTCPTINSNNTCLGYDVFECHANFQNNWESFAHREQQKKHVRICCIYHGGDDRQACICGPVPL